eukprot:CAMPEP_0198589172 /NCGR_PEP_ID=MMETSP1462-20131121/134049_1 /TAXON_ID=1333877 /ORGANISM="Brandtodinium nutriculum, Strain RCC3387" /LENGTH=39 /DNA_ID= /DNA_START= /DNA_END= /DNA_ORIENTATION=
MPRFQLQPMRPLTMGDGLRDANEGRSRKEPDHRNNDTDR